MVKIVIENLGQKELTDVDSSKSVLQVLQADFIDWMHACGGKGRCTTCKMIVMQGMDQLTPLSPAEHRYRQQGALGEHERLTCQVRALGTCIVRVPEESKLPHMTYTD